MRALAPPPSSFAPNTHTLASSTAVWSGPGYPARFSRVHFTTLFLGFDCEINLGLARNARRSLARSLAERRGNEAKARGRQGAPTLRSISHVHVGRYIAGTRRYNYCTSHNSLERYSSLRSSTGKGCYPARLLSRSIRAKIARNHAPVATISR